jgi:hypothetical protein
VIVCEVSRDTCEWSQVEHLFFSSSEGSLPAGSRDDNPPKDIPDMVPDALSPRITRASHTVVRIRRIQNLYQRRAYEAQREGMLRERGVDGVNEMQLFHGTRSRDPLLLALHRDGFMTEFASVGGCACA